MLDLAGFGKITCSLVIALRRRVVAFALYFVARFFYATSRVIENADLVLGHAPTPKQIDDGAQNHRPTKRNHQRGQAEVVVVDGSHANHRAEEPTAERPAREFAHDQNGKSFRAG